MNIKKVFHRISFVVVDVIAIVLMYYMSYIILHEFKDFDFRPSYWGLSVFYVCVKIFAHYLTDGYKILWKYRNRYSLFKLCFVTLSCNALILVIDTIFKGTIRIYFGVPLLLISFMMELCYLFASRVMMSIIYNYLHKKYEDRGVFRKRTLIIGAGSGGNLVLNEMGHNSKYGLNVVGFVDDSTEKIGNIINNVKVYGPISNLNTIIGKLYVQNIIIALPAAGNARIKEITNMINYKNVTVSVLPESSKLLQNTDIVKELRKVTIEDLLGRDVISLNKSELDKFISNQVVFVTGGGGSIGSEICRQVLEYKPKKLIVFDIYENSAYNLKMELDYLYKEELSNPRYEVLIGSVREYNRLNELFDKYRPNIVFHAAAHKHVPLMEDSPAEAIKNNVYGTYNVAKACDKYSVNKMVLISTDKAVNPTNVMGASKRICEMIVEAFNNTSKNTKYSMVRFGNVLGSNGSVIPLFQKQIENGGPLTVTHAEINRFFMTIKEACGLVIESGAYADGGEKFILDMGKPVKIIDLAKNMIKLSGLELDKDIKIEIVGLRPGEKLYEELLLDTSKATKTSNNKIFVEKNDNPFDLKFIENAMKELLEISNEKNCNKEILKYLQDLENIKAKRA